jgi:hypothetical protein
MTEPSSAPPPSPEAAPAAEPLEGVVPPAVLPLVRLLAPPPPEGAILVPPEPHEAPRRTWLLLELWLQIRLASKMYFDPRYRVSRLAQIAFPLFAGLLALNYFLFSVWFSIPVLSPIVERLLDAVLAVLAYRVLVRELDRYRTVLDYLARYTQPR